MASHLGTKYSCFKCEAKFYDLGRPAPVCPKCGADQRDELPEQKAARKRAKRLAEAAAAREQEERAVNEAAERQQEEEDEADDS